MTRKICLAVAAIVVFACAALAPVVTSARFGDRHFHRHVRAPRAFHPPHFAFRAHAFGQRAFDHGHFGFSRPYRPGLMGLRRPWRPWSAGPAAASRFPGNGGYRLPHPEHLPWKTAGIHHPILHSPPHPVTAAGLRPFGHRGPHFARINPNHPSPSLGRNNAPPGALERRGFFVPPQGERRFREREVVLDIAASPAELDAIARRYGLTRVETHNLGQTGRTMHRWRINDGRSVDQVIRTLAADGRIAGAQPNYVFKIEAQNERSAGPEGDPAQYVVGKLHLPEAHRLATGNHVLVAVIDSGIDGRHPLLAGVIAKRFDALGDKGGPHFHGTAIAGAIAAHGQLVGVAPRVKLLAVRVLDANGEGDTVSITTGLKWAIDNGAQVINMSFTGPDDPGIKEQLAVAHSRHIVLIAAAGNHGPASKPLYPAVDPNVIAVTATDADDQLYPQANRGRYIAIAAPGVDILVAAPNAAIDQISGTSLAAAHVSGVVALLIEHSPLLQPEGIRRILTSTARKLGPRAQPEEVGAGLVDAYQAIVATESTAAIEAKPVQPAIR